jgi:hypothetical protein
MPQEGKDYIDKVTGDHQCGADTTDQDFLHRLDNREKKKGTQ